jgi:transglutaminase-like putative cysteine protease
MMNSRSSSGALAMSRQAISRTLLLVLVCAVPAFAGVNVPDWVRQAAAETLPSYPPDTDAVVLLDDTTDTLNSPGEVTEHYRRVVRILRPAGRDYAHLSSGFRKDEKLNSIHAWSIDPAGHEYELKDKDFAESSSFDESLYSDIRLRVATAPAADPGTIVAFEVDKQRHLFLDELQWFIQERIPVRKVLYTLQLPAGYEYKELWANTEPVKANAVGGNRWQWIKTDVAGIEKEDYRPPVDALAARMQVNYFGGVSKNNVDGWDAIGKWYNGLTSDRRTATPEIKDKVAQLTAGKSDFDGKVRAIADFMQSEVRYVSIDIGIGGYQPHPAGDVFHFRYGDCKDKATLMSTMLHEAGIASDYVIIHTERGVAKRDVPSSLFNHAVLAIEIPAGTDASKYRSVFTSKSSQKMLLFDPTDSVTPVGEIGPHIQDRYALLVTPAGGEVVHTPVLDPDANHLVRRGTFKLSEAGSIVGSVSETRTGDSASEWRDVFLSSNENERTKRVESSVARSLTTAKIQNIKLDALDKRNAELVTKYDVSSDRYAQITGQLMLVRPRVIGRVTIPLEKKERKYPIELHATSRDDDEYAIEIPSGYIVDDMPEPTKVESSFGLYESHIEKDGSKIIYKRTYVNRALEIPKDKIAEFRDFQNRIALDENAVVVLKKAQ